MPVTPTFPGVYIEEISSGVRTITPVATSITAFIGGAPRGPADDPVVIQSISDYERQFGGIDKSSAMSYAVAHYFQNGGSEALVVRVTHADAIKAKVNVNGLPLEAASAGEWGNQLRARIDLDTKDANSPNPTLFNLSLFDGASGTLEDFRNVSTNPDDPRFIKLILEQGSMLARLDASAGAPSGRPGASGQPKPGPVFDDSNSGAFAQASGGANGSDITEDDLIGVELTKTGMFALEKADLFNILCLPPARRSDEISGATYAKALAYCLRRRAMLFVDPPISWTSVAAAVRGIDGFRSEIGAADQSKNAAIFFPRLRIADPKKENRLADFIPSAAVAGICAKTDVQRGVWKAPAGIEAGFSGVQEFTIKMTDAENGQLNPLGVNCLRNFPVHGNVVWGARTLAGADRQGSEWKYLPVRRFTLFLEESLFRGTQWVVFEPNDEPLWAQIRLNIGAFMRDLFRQGAFQGRTPAEAYFVKCDSETTTQNDINRGIVNIEVGFAPLKPAEFVIIKIQQIAGKIET